MCVKAEREQWCVCGVLNDSVFVPSLFLSYFWDIKLKLSLCLFSACGIINITMFDLPLQRSKWMSVCHVLHWYKVTRYYRLLYNVEILRCTLLKYLI